MNYDNICFKVSPPIFSVPVQPAHEPEVKSFLVKTPAEHRRDVLAIVRKKIEQAPHMHNSVHEAHIENLSKTLAQLKQWEAALETALLEM